MRSTSAVFFVFLLAGCGGKIDESGAYDADVDSGITPDIAVDTTPIADTTPIDTGPPPVICPPAPPTESTPCVGVGACSYTSPCTRTATCVGGKFHVVDGPDCKPPPPPPPPPCPAVEPKDGSACPSEGQSCTWKSVCGGTDTGVCKGGGWRLKIGTCPPPTKCPPSMPAAGGACTVTTEKCLWSNGCGGIASGECKMGAWVVSNPPCPPSCPSTYPGSGASCKEFSSHTCDYVFGARCTISCFCYEDHRWACYGTPCEAP